MSIDTIKSVNQFTNNLSDYYLNRLTSWISINKYTKIPSNFRTIRQEIIWGNQHIKFKNKSLIYFNWINDGIIFINDIVDHKGKLSENFILKKLSLKIIQYNGDKIYIISEINISGKYLRLKKRYLKSLSISIQQHTTLSFNKNFWGSG
jgi:hypothetical protein